MKILNSKSIIITTATIIILTIVIYLSKTWNTQNENQISEISKIVNIENSQLDSISVNTLPIQKTGTLGTLSENFIEELEKLENYDYKKITITKKDDGLIETPSEDLIYYFLDYKWKIGDDWYIQDVKNRKYYIPEGIIKIRAGTEFKWDPYNGDDDIDVILIYKKTVK